MAGLSRRQVRTIFVVGFVLGATAMPLIAALPAFLNNSVAIDGGVSLAAPSGPNVTVTGQADVNLSGDWWATNRLTLNTSGGNITFKSVGRTNATIDESEINGTWTNVTELDVDQNELYIDPEDKPAVNVSGGTDTLSIRDGISIDDGQVDFVYSGTSGTSNLTIRNLPADTSIGAINRSNDELLDGNTTDANGVLVLKDMPNSEHVVELQTSAGGPSVSDPDPEGQFTSFPTEANVTIDDADFPNDEVSVEFKMNGTGLGTDTVTTDGGEASAVIPTPYSGGTHTLWANATDDYGQTTNRSWTFTTPSNLTVRNATDPWAIINDREVEFTFYVGDSIVDRNTTNGKIDLDGIPIDSQIVADVSAIGYHDMSIVIEDISKQQTVYLVNDSTVSTVTVVFTLTDRTGGTFDNNNATLFVQKPINRTGTPTWKTMHAEEFGEDGVTAELETGQRYRLIVKNDIGDQRVLGTYLADASETVALEVGQVTAVPSSTELEYTWNATYNNNSASDPIITFQYNDTEDLTDELSVEIHERGNESNVLFQNQTFGGPIGTIGITETVPSDEADTAWVIVAVGERDGEHVSIREPVGPTRPVLPDMPGWLVSVVFLGTIWMVAGLFSQLNGAVGGLVVAGMGGMFYFVDLVPQETGIGVVLLSMILAGVLFVNEARSGGGL